MRAYVTYRITSRQALELLRQVHPFLRGCKRERAALALDHYLELTPRNGRPHFIGTLMTSPH